jgi:hypothetical protein
MLSGEGGIDRALGPRPAGDACASSKIARGDFVEPSGTPSQISKLLMSQKL